MNNPNDNILDGRFPTTHWSIVLDEDTSGDEKSASLEILFKMYWYPTRHEQMRPTVDLAPRFAH